MFQAILGRLKHALLDFVHPPPHALDVFPGTPGTIEYTITQRVLREMCDEDITINVTLQSVRIGKPAVWLPSNTQTDGDYSRGCIAVCRYLCRLARLYPVHPGNALCIDRSLDELVELINAVKGLQEQDDAYFSRFLVALESRMTDDALWLEGMDALSMADLCWSGALQYICKVTGKDIVVPHASQTPRLVRWWEAVQGLNKEDQEEKEYKKDD